MKTIVFLLILGTCAVVSSFPSEAIKQIPHEPLRIAQSFWKQSQLPEDRRMAPVWVTVEETIEDEVFVHESYLRPAKEPMPGNPTLPVRQPGPAENFFSSVNPNAVW